MMMEQQRGFFFSICWTFVLASDCTTKLFFLRFFARFRAQLSVSVSVLRALSLSTSFRNGACDLCAPPPPLAAGSRSRSSREERGPRCSVAVALT